MDIRAILKARNLSDENIEALVTNPAYSGILEGFISEAEDGKTALLNAKQIQDDLKSWNDKEVVPYVRKADAKVAEAQAKIAAMTTHMKSLKDAGYEIPDAYLVDAPVAPPLVVPAAADPSKMIDDRSIDIAKTNMALISLSNKYRGLTGNELDPEAEYEDFSKNKRPGENLRSYVDRKYDLGGLQAKKDSAREQKKLDDYASEKVKLAIAEEKQKHGENGETRTPRSSRWDKVQEQPERAKLWQTKAGREQATKERLAKYQVQ